MTTFPTWTPPAPVNLSPGSSRDYEPRVKEASFGDGYSQRTGDGINALSTVLNGQFRTLTASEATAVLSFFRTQAGYKPFLFTPPGSSTARQWICPKWSETYQGLNNSDVSFVLKENFDPG